MIDPDIQSAVQGAVQDAFIPLLPQFTIPTTANSTPATILGCTVKPPATVRVTRNCRSDSTTSDGYLPCLDLDYISFCDGIQSDQDNPTITFTPISCANSTWGCAVGWLAQFAPAVGIADPANIVAAGPASAPKSPPGNTASCSGDLRCRGAWIKGNSHVANLDVFGVFSDWVTGLLLEDTSGSVVLPSTPANYVARFYSGGSADSWESSHIDDYTDGASLNMLAAGINLAETAYDADEFLFDSVDALFPGADTSVDRRAVARCALLKLKRTAIETAVGQAFASVSGGVKAIGGLSGSLLTNAVSCVVAESAKSLFKFGVEALAATTGAGYVMDVAVNSAAAAAHAAQAVQRSYELQNSASAVETAVIAIYPGSTLNPVPRITSLSPSSAPTGTSSQSVTIRGNYFMESSTVTANNAKQRVTVGNDGEFTITLNSSDLAKAGTFTVAVTNPPPGGGTSEAIFTVGNASSIPQPQITSLKPSSAPAGTNLLVLSILGKNFLPNCTVTFNGSSQKVTTPFDAGQLTTQLSPSDIAKTGIFPVVVTNPGPGNLSSTFDFTVLDLQPSQPAVTSVSTIDRVYVVGAPFEIDYTVLAGTASGTFDLMMTIVSLASGKTYYYYDDASDPNSRWLHTKQGSAATGIPKTGSFPIPTDPSAFQITDSVPTGDYHVKAYFSTVGANQPAGAIAETDFSVATSTPAGTCFVATAAFGSPMARQVQWLRAFRDRTLLSAGVGRAFVHWYYGWSPRAAAWLRGHALARKLTRMVLWIPVGFAWLSLRTNAALALLGFLALLLSLGWSLRRGPVWWRVLCLLVLVIGLASAHTSDKAPGQSRPTTPSQMRDISQATVVDCTPWLGRKGTDAFFVESKEPVAVQNRSMGSPPRGNVGEGTCARSGITRNYSGSKGGDGRTSEARRLKLCVLSLERFVLVSWHCC